MDFDTLNASSFEFNEIFYNSVFEGILTKVVFCYQRMLSDKVVLKNDENSIRDCILYSYLKKETFKKQYGLTNYLFDAELPENTGRIDIRIMPINPFICDKAYYVIECKRLDVKNPNGTSGLNSQYISEGINRFVSEKYSSYYGTNGMIGFIVQKMDIHANIASINNLLQNNFINCNTTKALQPKDIGLENFKYCYCSKHGQSGNDILIYHLMLDFSMNIR